MCACLVFSSLSWSSCSTWQAAARAIGHNPSWPLEEKRKLMLDLKSFYEGAVRKGPATYDIFADHRHALDDDY
jgi:hypothetical protein